MKASIIALILACSVGIATSHSNEGDVRQGKRASKNKRKHSKKQNPDDGPSLPTLSNLIPTMPSLYSSKLTHPLIHADLDKVFSKSASTPPKEAPTKDDAPPLPQQKFTEISMIGLGTSAETRDGNRRSSTNIQAKHTQFSNSVTKGDHSTLLTSDIALSVGERIGVRANLDYQRLTNTAPMHPENIFRLVRFATGYGVHAEVDSKDHEKTDWSIGIDYGGYAFIDDAFSAGPVISLEANQQFGLSVKTAVRARYWAKKIIGTAEVSGNSPFTSQESEALYRLSLDVNVYDAYGIQLFLGGEVSNRNYKRMDPQSGAVLNQSNKHFANIHLMGAF